MAKFIQLTRAQANDQPVLINLDNVFAIMPLNDGCRIYSTADGGDGPHTMTVRENFATVSQKVATKA